MPMKEDTPSSDPTSRAEAGSDGCGRGSSGSAAGRCTGRRLRDRPCARADGALRPFWYTRVPMATTLMASELPDGALIGHAPASPAGPLDTEEPVRLPPPRPLPRVLQTVRFGMRPLSFNPAARAGVGDVWGVPPLYPAGGVVVSTPPRPPE